MTRTRIFIAILSLVGFAVCVNFAAIGADEKLPSVPEKKWESNKPTDILPTSGPNITSGLQLPVNQTVDIGEGFIEIKADCEGEVKWLVVSNVKVKYLAFSKLIIVAIPSKSGQVISVFAVGMVDGNLTDFVRTNITVRGNTPSPSPSPTGKPVIILSFRSC